MSMRGTASSSGRWIGSLVLLTCLGSIGCGKFVASSTAHRATPANSRSDSSAHSDASPSPSETPQERAVLDPSRQLPLPETTRTGISALDLEAHVRALTDPSTTGRRAGTNGELVAVDYLARAFASVGLEAAGVDGGPLHSFRFTSGIDLGATNELAIVRAGHEASALEIDDEWRPLAFSRLGAIAASPVVFAGYGLLVPEDEHHAAIDDYAAIDVRDRWVLVFRDLPHSLDADRHQALQRHASLRYKAMVARDQGAIGILFVSGPLGRFREELVPLRFDASLAGTRIAVVSIRDEIAERLLAKTGVSLEALQANADNQLAKTSSPSHHATHLERLPSIREAEFPDIRLSGHIDLETRTAEGTNVLGRLQVGETASRQTIVLGAHFDHLGHGEGSGSLASGSDVGRIHSGADDNASGTALLIEIAEFLVGQKRAGVQLGERDFIFAAWSGEEIGLLGSNAWVEEQINPHSNQEGPVAYLNFDMVGRLREKLIVQGLGSSPDWAELLERAAAPLELSIATQQDSYLPTDATSFYTQSVPVLSAFTGVHSEYHTPQDTLALLNLEGTAEIGVLFARIAEELSRAASAPAYHAQQAPASGVARSGFRVFLGTVPDYAQTDIRGVRLSGVAPAGPAEQAGMRGGDIIVDVDGRPIENLYDYTYSLEALRVGVGARIGVLREGERIELEVVPGSRD